ncbi:hypothetical protein AAC387_Pa02g1476 [Persea americana]
MALIAHQTWASCGNSTTRPEPGNKPLKLKAFVSFQPIGRTNRRISLKRRFSLSIQSQSIFLSKGKPCKISSFKGNSAQYDESGNRTNNSNASKNSVQLSYAAQEREETIIESPDVQKDPLSNMSEEKEEETITGSPAIRQLFKKWLIVLRTPTSTQPTEKIFEESLPQTEVSEQQNGNRQLGAAGQLMKAALGYFLGLDATIKFPTIIFVPLYLAVNIVYGVEVSKELLPLWVLGPVIVALYIKMIQGLCALYVFTFKQAFKLVKNLPTYCLLVYRYVAEGKLNEFLRVHLWHPVTSVRSLDYKELGKKKLKEVEEWAVEKYLDYIESIWPYYCRTIRFLKKANLI